LIRVDRTERPVWHVMLAVVAILTWPFKGDIAFAEGELVLPSDEVTIALGKDRYGAKCSGFCHGSSGKGARAPCLICGVFKRGSTNTEIVRNITLGVKGTAMGAFGEVFSQEEIVAIVSYLRGEQKKKEAEGN